MRYAVNRRRLLALTAGLSAAAACGNGTKPLGPSASDAAAKAKKKPKATIARTDLRPNIVEIVVDDVRAADLARMPLLQSKVRNQGVLLTNYITQNPVCSPSRASMLTGLYSHSHGVTINGRLLNEATPTIPQALQAAGYETGHFGKWMHGYGAEHRAPGFTKWFLTDPFAYFDYTLNEDGNLSNRGSGDANYQSAVVQDAAVEWVREKAFAGTPFYAQIWPFSAHGNAKWETQYSGLYADLSGKDRNRMRSLATVDEIIRRVVNKLTNAGQIENTYILVTSDNGFMFGDEEEADGETGKRHPYEESVNVSAYLRGPGIAPGSTDERQWANIDLAATYAQIAGISFPSDGISLLGENTREQLIIESWSQANGLVPWHGWRTNSHTHVEYDDGRVLDLER